MQQTENQSASDPEVTTPTYRAAIADDEAFIRESLRLILREKNIQVVAEASNGEKILELLQKTKVDFLFLDIMMPKMDGLEVLQKATQLNPNLKVIMISGSATKETVQTVAKMGAHGFVVKPFNPDSLFKSLERLL